MCINGKEEQQRVSASPGNAHCMSIRQVSLWRARRCCSRCYAAASATGAAASAASIGHVMIKS